MRTAIHVVVSIVFLTILIGPIGGAECAYAAGDVRISMNDGHVTLTAHAATLKDILDAWARAGQTAIVNSETLAPGAPLTLELTDVKEEDALAVLLRPLSGYLTMRRSAPLANVSKYDRIVLLPTSVANHDSTVINTAPPPPPFQPPPPQQTVMINGVARLVGPNGALVEDDQQDAPPVNAPRGFTRGDAPPPPLPQPTAGTPPPAPQQTPGIVGASTPGVVVAPQTASPAVPTQR